MQSIIIWAGVLGSVFGIVTSVTALVALYRSSIRKGYAAERDFNHLQRNYESLAKNIEFIAKDLSSDIQRVFQEVDNRCDRIDLNQTEIKALLLANLGVIKPKSTD